jgi:hypothetical protein
VSGVEKRFKAAHGLVEDRFKRVSAAMTTNSRDAALRRMKQLHIHSTQGYSGVLTRESQIVFNYLTAQPDAEISLTMPPGLPAWMSRTSGFPTTESCLLSSGSTSIRMEVISGLKI